MDTLTRYLPESIGAQGTDSNWVLGQMMNDKLEHQMGPVRLFAQSREGSQPRASDGAIDR